MPEILSWLEPRSRGVTRRKSPFFANSPIRFISDGCIVTHQKSPINLVSLSLSQNRTERILCEFSNGKRRNLCATRIAPGRACRSGVTPTIVMAVKSWSLVEGDEEMPLFEFRCSDCEHDVELLIRGQEQPVCPTCGSRALEKLFSETAVGAREASLPIASSCPPAEAGPCARSMCCRRQMG